jgi:PsbP-like protein
MSSFLISILILLFALLTSITILQETKIPQRQNNMILVNVAFASTLVNSNSSATVTPAQPNNFSLYNNSTYGIQFQSPDDWKKIETLTGRTTFVQFISPSRNMTGGIEPPAHVTISIEKGLGNVTTLRQYSQASDKLLDRVLGNFTTTSQPITLSGLPATSKIIATKHPTSGITISMAQVFAIKNNNAYSITYTVPTSSYYRYLPVVQQILNSFQIAGPVQTPPTPATPTPLTSTPPTSNAPATTSPPAISSEPECVPGFHWDNSQRQCVSN